MYRLFSFLICVVYFQGVLRLMMGPTMLKSIIEGLILIITLKSIQKKSFFNVTASSVFLLFFLSYIASLVINTNVSLNSSTFNATTFFRPFLYGFLILASSYTTNLHTVQLKKILILIFFLTVLQIPVATLKLLFMGIGEKFVGTISISGGSLHVVFPLMAISYMLACYLFLGKNKKYIYWIIGLIFFGITGGKKGIPFYTVFILFASYVLYNLKYIKKSLNFRSIITLLVVSVLCFYCGVKLIPGLNKEHVVGGSFDYEYLVDKTYSYSFYDAKKDAYIGRFGGSWILVRDMFSHNTVWLVRSKTENFFFGYGPLSFFKDNYLEKNLNIDKGFNRFIPTGFFRMFFSLGLTGVIGFVLFYGTIFKRLMYIFSEIRGMSQLYKMLTFGSLLACLFCFVDFFTYSHMYTYPTIYVVFFFIVGQVFRIHDNKKYASQSFKHQKGLEKQKWIEVNSSFTC